jgi:hypothetical protein
MVIIVAIQHQAQAPLNDTTQNHPQQQTTVAALPTMLTENDRDIWYS